MNYCSIIMLKPISKWETQQAHTCGIGPVCARHSTLLSPPSRTLDNFSPMHLWKRGARRNRVTSTVRTNPKPIVWWWWLTHLENWDLNSLFLQPKFGMIDSLPSPFLYCGVLKKQRGSNFIPGIKSCRLLTGGLNLTHN